MSKHKMVNGKLLQMNKTYKDLKNRQRDKIAGWMYEAYGKGIGGKILHEGVKIATEQLKAKKIYLEAQEYAIGYFAKE